MYSQWDSGFIRKYHPSIEFLELFAVLAGVITWLHRFKNARIILFCDNKSVCAMINSTSTCKQCMTLVRILVLHSMKMNTRIFMKYIKSKCNNFADNLSRLKLSKFRRTGCGKFEIEPTNIPDEIWPLEKVWTFN